MFYRITVRAALLAAFLSTCALGPAVHGQRGPADRAVYFASDSAENARANEDGEISPDLEAYLVQFSQPGAAGGGRTVASTAGLQRSSRSVPENFSVRLARAPKMLGDFFGRADTEIIIQPPSFIVTYTDFFGAQEFEGLGDGNDLGGARFADLGTDVEFVPNTVFGQTVTGVAFRGVEAGLLPNADNVLDIVGQTGSGTTDMDALNQVQQNADNFLPSGAAANQASQQAAIISTNGPGTFSDPNGPGDVVTVDDPIARTTSGTINTATPFTLTLPYTVEFADDLFTPAPQILTLPTPSAGDIVGRVRVQDNNSAMPQNRCFFDYNFFHNVPLTAAGIDISRFSPGLERTFWSDMASIEFRVPMAVTLSSDIVSDEPYDVSRYEFGNVGVISKFLLAATEDSAFSAGLGVSIPTADDFNIQMSDGTELLELPNESVHLLPFVAWLFAPSYSDWFTQVFVTGDFDTNGTPVLANTNGARLNDIGTWQDQHLITASGAAGSWLYQNNYGPGLLRRVGWSAELHYTATLNGADSVSAGNYVVGNSEEDLSLLNGILGGHVTLGQATFTTGYAVPLTSSDRVFDGELRFFVNRLY